MNIMYLNPIEYQQVPHTTFIYSKHWPQPPRPRRSMDIFNGENIGHENAHMSKKIVHLDLVAVQYE